MKAMKGGKEEDDAKDKSHNIIGFEALKTGKVKGLDAA